MTLMFDIVQVGLGVPALKCSAVALSAASPRSCLAVGFPLRSLTRKTLCALLVFATGCSQPNTSPNPVLLGEWMSDSNAYEGGPWREFIFIDSSGTFTRTSWFSEDYVLNSNLLLKGDDVVKGDSIYFHIRLLDSFNITVTSNWYKGRFHRSFPVTSEHFEEARNRFVVGDSIKKRMAGSWDIVHHEMLKPDSTLFIPEELLADLQERPFLGGYPVTTLTMSFTKDNRLVISSDSVKTEFEYLVDDNTLSLSKFDYVIKYKYSFRGDSLCIEESRGATKRELIFVKTP